MGQVLYRKYRSRALSAIIGQEHITKTLANALKSDSLSHAYLFTGPRGVGKTSVARILAYEANQLSYETESTHLDIIEIDAASNRRIDEIRELRERIGNAPTSARYKIYIIDEVHMLTKEAFNALLKTLEEPPAHVIFILATTEAHKLPATIISRTQHFSFKPIDIPRVIKHLASIAQKEGLDATSEALELIARHGEGSFRDSISLLDQIASHSKKIDADSVRTVLGEAPEDTLSSLTEALLSKNTADAAHIMGRLKAQGILPEALSKQLAGKLRQRLLDDPTSPSIVGVFKLLRRLIDVPTSHDPAAALEITLFEYSLLSPSISKMNRSVSGLPAKSVAKAVRTNVKHSTANSVQLKKLNQATWLEILDYLKASYSTLYGLARMAKPSFHQNHIALEFIFPFHQKRFNDEHNKKIIQSVVKEVSGADVDITCVLANEQRPISASKTKVGDRSSVPDSISNIFDGAEIVD